MESILSSIKKLLGIADGDYCFDTDIIIHINTVFSILTSLGIGPSEGFSICDNATTWNEYIGDNFKFESLKTYVYLRVKLMFDPPTSSAAVESINKLINELEWRLFIDS